MAVNRDKILKGAEKLVQKGKVDAAIREYEKLLKLNPNDVNTINRIGDLYNRVGQVDKAVELYERIADSFAADGFTNKAIAIYKKINRLAPDRVQVFERLADLYSQQGLAVEARDQFTVLVDWYLKNEDLERAVAIQRKLLQSDPDNHLAHLKLADLLIRKGDAPEAVGVYERLGKMLLDSGKIDEAERLYRHAVEQNPPSGEFLLPVAEALVDAGKVPTAREFLAEAKKRSPDSTAIGLLDLKVALAAGESTAALRQAESLLRLEPEHPDIRFNAGRAFLGAGETDRGKELLLAVARSRLDGRDRAGAQRAFQVLMKHLSHDEEVLKLGTQVLSPTEDGDMLLAVRASLADRHFQDGRHAEARRLYSDLIREDPDNHLFRERLHELGVGPAPERPATPEPVVEPGGADRMETGTAEPVVPEAPLPPVEPVTPPPTRSPAEGHGFDPSERLAEANVFAKYGLLDKALHHLDTIVEAFPDHLEARERRVVLSVEAGRSGEVADDARSLVQAYTERGDQEALDRMSGMFPDLGEPSAPAVSEDVVEIEIIEETFESEEAAAREAEAFLPEPMPEEIVEPLELEEVDPESFEPREIEPVREGLEFESVETEEPPQPPGGAAAGPEFSGGVMDWIEDLEQSVKGGGRPPAPPAAEVEPEPPGRSEPVPEPMPEPESKPEEPLEIEPLGGPPKSDLSQMDSFLENSLYEDATRLLRRLEAEHPESRELAERRLALKAKGFLMGETTQVEEAASDLFVDEEEAYVDLAAELEEELAAEEAIVEKAAGPGDGEVSLEDVFREFQKGVAEQLSEEDADTHFNLGIAYKEMGLLPEAIREFQVASKDPNFLIECCSMIGACYIDQGLWDQAAEWYERALETPNLDAATTLALRYELAGCLEGSGDVDGALRSFETISETDPSFRDVSNRISQLAAQQQAN